MPDIYQRKGAAVIKSQYNHVLFIQKATWGLACDKVSELVMVNRDQVHWRTAKGKRAWLAGTATEQSCAILDVDALVKITQN